eukprot:1145576-Pelagomonas_calceolata.AAC.4
MTGGWHTPRGTHSKDGSARTRCTTERCADGLLLHLRYLMKTTGQTAGSDYARGTKKLRRKLALPCFGGFKADRHGLHQILL